MKKQQKRNPTGHTYTTMKQVCNLIPGHMVLNLAKEYGIDEQCRTFSEWSHVVALTSAQLTHAIGLNDVCDSLQMHQSTLSTTNGSALIGDWQSKVYSFEADWIVPNVSTGTCRIRLLAARQDGYAYVNANIPGGVDGRPYGTDGKEIARDIVAGGTTPAIQNEVLTKASTAFETLSQAQYRAGGVVQNVQIPDNLAAGSVATCRWSILSYPSLQTRIRVHLPVEDDVLGAGVLKGSSNAWWRLPSTGKVVEYNGSAANDSLEKVTAYYGSKVYNYQYLWSVPSHTGTCTLVFEVTPSPLTNWVGAIVPENVDGTNSLRRHILAH